MLMTMVLQFNLGITESNSRVTCQLKDVLKLLQVDDLTYNTKRTIIAQSDFGSRNININRSISRTIR